MKYTLKIAPIVHDDLRHIESYIALDKPSAAKKVVKKITTAIRSLPDNPFIAAELRKKYGLDTDLRGRIVKPYIIIYDVKGTHIKAYRVFDCRSDYLAILGFTKGIDDTDDE